jgi:hypothetical protein
MSYLRIHSSQIVRSGVREKASKNCPVQYLRARGRVQITNSVILTYPAGILGFQLYPSLPDCPSSRLCSVHQAGNRQSYLAAEWLHLDSNSLHS